MPSPQARRFGGCLLWLLFLYAIPVAAFLGSGSTSTVRSILREAIPLITLMSVGYVAASLRPAVFSPVTLEGLGRFAYNIAIPATVFQGLATRDLQTLDWDFVGLIMLLRDLMAAGCIAFTLMQHFWQRRRDRVSLLEAAAPRGFFSPLTADPVGTFLASWVASTWINTIIFGK